MRIIVVDRDPDLLELITTLLELDGHRVSTARDGVAAQRLAAELQPDVVLTEIRLPELDGVELARRIREQPGGADIQLVAHTTHLPAAVPMDAKSGGFDVHLRKPASAELLRRTVRELGRKR
ncbi:MAG TPA: response regulator [Nannocystaceae bacterium]|nr:response regulator [Nannocystaceae bacterium]